MEYSDYTKEQVMTEFGNYQELCELFFSLAKDDETKNKLEHILYEGGYKGFSFSSKIVNKDNPYIEIKRRASLAYLLIRNPETFDNLVDKQVNLFHGTKPKFPSTDELIEKMGTPDGILLSHKKNEIMS